MVAAVIVDIVGSRRIRDRTAAQRALDEALAALEHDFGASLVPLHPIVGDELQGVYPGLDPALRATLLLQLALPDEVECRFGVGLGEVGMIPSAAGGISDGPAWWAAREAIDAVQTLARRAVPDARTRAAASVDPPRTLRHVNAYLLARDRLVGAMSERTRRLTRGRCLGVTQRDLAAAEGITQSAVSQALAAAGASAVVEGYRLLDE